MKFVAMFIFLFISNSSFATDLPPYFSEQVKKSIFSGQNDIEITVKTKDLSKLEESLKSQGYFYTKIRKEFTTSIFIHVLSNLDVELIKKYKLQVDRRLLVDQARSCPLFREDADVFNSVVKIPDTSELVTKLDYGLIDSARNRLSLYCNKKINRFRHFVSKIDFLKLVAKNPDYYLY